MKTSAKRLVAVILALVLSFGTLTWLNRVTQYKEGLLRMGAFFDCAPKADVLFFGTSHVMDGIQPMDIWRDRGVSAYSLSTGGNTMPMIYWAVVNALRYGSPKLIVLDCYSVSSPEKLSNIGYLHIQLDAFPLSAEKLRAVWDLCQAPDFDIEDRLSFIWPFILYHARWDELEPEDIQPTAGSRMGGSYCVNVAAPDAASDNGAAMELTEDMPGVTYLRRIAELCQERGIELLLTYLPFPATDEERQEANAVQSLADEYGLEYINFQSMDTVDFQTDMFDANSHLNPSGARKVTAYLGEYIQARYGIEDHRGDPDYSRWADTLAPYLEEKQTLLRSQTMLSNFLMLLQDRDMSFALCLREGSKLYGEPVYPALIKNACGGLEPELLDAAAQSGEGYILIADKDGGRLIECLGGENLAQTQTGFGSVEYVGGVLRIDGAEYTPNAGDDARLFVFDTATGENIGADYGFSRSESGLFERNYAELDG